MKSDKTGGLELETRVVENTSLGQERCGSADSSSLKSPKVVRLAFRYLESHGKARTLDMAKLFQELSLRAEFANAPFIVEIRATQTVRIVREPGERADLRISQS